MINVFFLDGPRAGEEMVAVQAYHCIRILLPSEPEPFSAMMNMTDSPPVLMESRAVEYTPALETNAGVMMSIRGRDAGVELLDQIRKWARRECRWCDQVVVQMYPGACWRHKGSGYVECRDGDGIATVKHHRE